MQGDCLSAILFILYLAECLNENNENTIALDHTQTNTYQVDPFYADDTTFAGINEDGKNRLQNIETNIPKQLAKANLQSNESKKETYIIPRPPPPKPPEPSYTELLEQKTQKIQWSELDYLTYNKPPTPNPHPDWEKCKLLGSYLNTKKDIQNRKILTITSFNSLQDIFNTKHLSLQTKIKTFNTFIDSVMLYNSELWTLGKTTKEEIDAFQRKLLRKITGHKWPKIITNEKLYKLTKTEPWSIKIQRRRLTWTGHLLRLHIDTPARKSLEEALKPIKRKQGRPPRNWIQQIIEDLNEHQIIQTNSKNPKEIFQELQIVTENRKTYREKIKNAIPRNTVPTSGSPEEEA